MLIDTHCHLNFGDYGKDELEGLVSRALENGVSLMVNIGSGDGLDGNKSAVLLVERFPQVFCTVGIHPHDAELVVPSVLKDLEKLAAHEKVVAVGEVGLDFHYNNSPQKKQEEVLVQFVELAKRVKKPLVIHDRGAGDRTWQILGGNGVKETGAVIHCFGGTKELAKKYLDMGCLLSFTGIVTFKNAAPIHEVVRFVPVEKMMVETDSPFLAPEPFRGKRNEPAYVRHVAEAVARIKGLSFEDVARITTLNARRFFSLPVPDPVASIAYAIRDSLYLNITNRCTLACRFCPKFTDYEVKGYYLKLPKEPTADEVVNEAGDVSKYREVVFCGYGEPTRKLPVLIEVAMRLKKKHLSLKIRLNTDGLANLVYGRNILPEIAPFVDALSVSLNAPDDETYVKYCPSKYGKSAYLAVRDFIREAVKHIPDVTATVVGLPDVDRRACEKVAKELGAKFRYREYNEVG